MPAHHQLDPERAAALPAPEVAAAPEAAAPHHPMLRQQRQIGNARVARMRALQREAAPDEEEEELLQAKRDPALQREAMPDEEEEELLQAKRDPALQREAMPDEEEEELLQAMPEVGLEGGPVSDGLAQRIDSRRGGGAPLDSDTREHMESAIGAEFGAVRVHSDSEAHQLSRSISAKAFTTGNDIFLGAGASSSDRSLLAHELTHVVQQRTMDQSGPMTVGPADDAYEQEADSTARAVTSGQPPAARKADEE